MDWKSKWVESILEAALAEDKVANDITTALTIRPNLRASGTLIAKQAYVVSDRMGSPNGNNGGDSASGHDGNSGPHGSDARRDDSPQSGSFVCRARCPNCWATTTQMTARSATIK